MGHAFDDEYSVTIHHNTAEEMKRTAQFLKHRAFWHPAAEAPEKDGYYLATVAGRIFKKLKFRDEDIVKLMKE